MRVRNIVIAGIASAQLLIGGSVAAVSSSSAGSPAFADASGYCGASSNGCTNSGATSGSCAGHGAFGAFGNFAQSGSPHDFGQGIVGTGYPTGPNGVGANGQQTGANNANLCGNPQGNP